jgi:hypothetical protein
MAYKHLFIGRANSVLHKLAQECLRKGRLPANDPLRKLASAEQSGWYLKSIGPLNAEIARLETLLGAPSESHRTNSSPPGADPATGAPPSLPNALPASVAVAIKHLTPPPESGIDLEVLSAVIDATWGRGMSRNLTQRAILASTNHASKEDQAAAPYSEAAATRVMEGLTKNAQAQLAAENSTEAKAEDFAKLRRFCQKAGVAVNGLSYRGLKPVSGGETLEPASLAIAQRRVDAFVATLEGSDVATDPDVVQAARKFISQKTGQPFTIGLTLKNPPSL